jgi:hypothetical protein
MIRASDRKPFLLEMNTSPGMTGALAGAHVRARRRHELRGSCACRSCRGRAGRRPDSPHGHGHPQHLAAAARPPPLPVDVRLMNAAARCGAGRAVAAGRRGEVAGRARRCSRCARSASRRRSARNSVATIRANALPRLQGNFFSIDLPTARRAFESVPWVRHAVVQRVWPDRLAVRWRSTGRRAVAGRGRRNDRLVNSHGEVFEANVGDVEDDALPVLAGPEARQQQMLDAASAPAAGGSRGWQRDGRRCCA